MPLRTRHAARWRLPPSVAASLHRQVAVSGPLTLANGDAGVYIAVPVEAHRFSGDVSRLESRSAIVGLIDAQMLVAQGFEGHSSLPLELKDGAALLASFGGHLEDPVSTSVAVPGQRWMVAVDGGSIPAFERALPWLILSVGLALAFAVARLLSNATRRRDAALRAEHDAREDLERAHADAERRSREDALTGIFNRRHFGERLERSSVTVGPNRPTQSYCWTWTASSRSTMNTVIWQVTPCCVRWRSASGRSCVSPTPWRAGAVRSS